MLRVVHVMVASSAASARPGSGGTSAASASSGSGLHEPLVYFCGTLKNVSNDASNQRGLVKAGALHVLCAALTGMVGQVAPEDQGQGSGGSGSSSTGGPVQVAVQITGVLRNLAVAPAHVGLFLSAGALPALKAASSALGAWPAGPLCNARRAFTAVLMHKLPGLPEVANACATG